MTTKFRFSGQAEIRGMNTRKEGPEDDKILAVDLKLTITGHADDLIGPFEPALKPALFLPGNGAVRNIQVGPVPLQCELEHYRMVALGSTFGDCLVRKIVLEPMDGWLVSMAFTVSFKPSGDEVARIAEHLAEPVEILLEPESMELDL